MNPKEIPDISRFRHRQDLQIRFSDVDILGHVNNTVYLAFYDTGKAHYFRTVRNTDFRWSDVETVIANVNCAFMAPIVFGEAIEVLTRCEEIHEKSFKLLQILREKHSGEIKSMCETVMVGYDVKNKVSMPVSDQWRRAFEEYENQKYE